MVDPCVHVVSVFFNYFTNTETRLPSPLGGDDKGEVLDMDRFTRAKTDQGLEEVLTPELVIKLLCWMKQFKQVFTVTSRQLQSVQGGHDDKKTSLYDSSSLISQWPHI